LELSEIPNLKLDAETPAHQLIEAADVVVSFGSTTMAEAALAGKPVVVPYFAEVHRNDYTDYVFCRDDLHLFDVAESPEAIEQLVQQRLLDPVIEAAVMEHRAAFFERYVSNCEGNSLDQYLAAIEDAIANPGEPAPASCLRPD
jgi:lipid A disaccharide synthetase